MMLKYNAHCLKQELEWFEKFLQDRMAFFKQNKKNDDPGVDFLLNHQALDFRNDKSNYAYLIHTMHQESSKYYEEDWLVCMHIAERILLILALIPHIRPQMLDVFFVTNENNRECTNFGGAQGVNHKGFIPTGETAMFLLAGNNLELRFFFQTIFNTRHFFFRNQILNLNASNTHEPFLSGSLEISKEYLQMLTTAEPYQPDYSTQFPAQRIETKLSWDDLVLDYFTRQDIDEVQAWIKHYKNLMTDPQLGKEIQGYRCLFYGPSGTGKTLTTTLLGQEVGLDVYRIDLSKIVSKYIGETEKKPQQYFHTSQKQKLDIIF